ncbi:MAG: hypothetical protein ACREPM_26015 [Gemmatimonadaceae bacterium]
MHDWAGRMYGSLPTGPGLAVTDVGFGFMFVVVGFIGGAAVARGRRVG